MHHSKLILYAVGVRNRSIADPWEVSQDVCTSVGWFDAMVKPPNEVWVEVKDYSNCIGDTYTVVEAMAFYGRDGYKPHWQLRDGTCCSPSRFNSWRFSCIENRRIEDD